MATAVIAIALNLCASLAASGARMTALNTLALDRLQGLSELQSQFSEAVREGMAVVPEVGGHRTGPDKVVLALPVIEGRNRWLILGDLNGCGRMMKGIVSEGPGELQVEFGSSFGPPLGLLHFSFPQAPIESIRLISLEVTVKQERGERPTTAPPHRFMAALRGL